MNYLIVVFGKLVSHVSRVLNMGNGSTWPGHIALSINKNFIRDMFRESNVKIILVCGTNGKTTTSKIIETILTHNKDKILTNESGSNLLNGIASSIVLGSTLTGKLNQKYAVFEVDENTVPHALSNLSPDVVIALNLFRDQLDRYGEVDSISKLWSKSFGELKQDTILILNADDPQIAILASYFKGQKVYYFGLSGEIKNTKIEHASDSTICPKCSGTLKFTNIVFSHLGEWSCMSCDYKRPKTDLSNTLHYPLIGTYNKYNTLASVLLSKKLGVADKVISSALLEFKPAFGRQEKISYKDKNVWLYLAKNPTGFNETLKTLTKEQNNNFLFVLNDRIPDGKDVSWIWDVDFEDFINKKNKYFVSGDRVYDMGLRLKYSGVEEEKLDQYEVLRDAINELTKTPDNSLYIVATYTGMLEARKILTGKKIL